MLNREELEAEAKELGLKFPANIGDEKLAERVAEARKAKAEADAADGTSTQSEAGTTEPTNGAPATTDEGGESTDGAKDAPKDETGGEPEPEEAFAHVSNAGPMVAVNCAIPGGRRRGGRRWPGGVTEVPLDDFTKAMANALDRDPMFTMVMPD